MKYILRKVGFFFLTLWVAISLNFFIPRLMPGNPAENLIARFQGQISDKALKAIEIAFGINVNQSMWSQYIEYIKNIFRGEFGVSFVYFPTPVIKIIKQSLPWTLGLVGIATIISFVVGTLMGVYVAWKRNGKWSSSLLVVAIFIRSFPYFWLGLLMLYVFGFVLGWFPMGGAYSTRNVLHGFAYFESVIYHGFLPALTIVISSLGGWLLTMRNNMISVLAEDYITVAEAKGLKEKEIMLKYAARNAILPSITGFAMSLGFIVGGAILTEIVYSYPGMGYVMYQAVVGQDYPLMQAIFLMISVAVLSANLVADLVYALVDPRVRS